MCTPIKFIKSDFYKIRRTAMFWIHIIVPILISLLFVAYYGTSTAAVDNVSKMGLYMQILSVGFPLIIGIVCAMDVEQEYDAGNFQGLLMSEHKLLSFSSKICMLLFMAFFSLIIAIGIFVLGLEFLVHKDVFNFYIYGNIILILLFSQIFLYILHLLLSFCFGTGVSIGLGIAESLVSALMLTGLGDVIGKWIPCSWGGRIIQNYIILNSDVYDINVLLYKFQGLYMNEFKLGIYICGIATIILFLLSLIWYNYFEGRSEN
ncbi:lantibiotic immunity ABC transporter MutG family permease subunit [Clostridium kluyveri]|uniref:Transporter n=1 Tax=Clostridium kluyveri TaxID=1534 RepID=A0A1L5F6Q6_CLOKL|nr:lantibiotic immunity ABC transporter MutG family permease subunit [Clostridium kluyveri]APM38667.1 transporter [Clostridium kluyveri]UZQ50982.1 lantibiotic immunity ABC transporter MutG family permease subunit [Clostridium kluyveri]